MVIDQKLPNYDDAKSTLYDRLVLGRVSSLEMLSTLTGLDENDVRDTIEELVEDGSLAGSFTDDGKRFFLSDVKTSIAPVVGVKDQGLEIARADTKIAKLVGLTGFLMLILGQVFRSLVGLDARFDTLGTVLFMLGLGVLIAGWYQYSRLEPPSEIR